MAVLQKVKIHDNERLDLNDFDLIDEFTCADFSQMFKQIFNSTSYILRGFRIFQDVGLTNAYPTSSPVYVEAAGSVLIHSNAPSDVMFVGAPGTAPTQLALTANATNYIEMDLTTETASPDTRAFWDATDNNGQGGEFSDVVDTVQNLIATISINTVGFSGGTKVPIARIQVNNGGTIVGLYDRRNLFGALEVGQPWNNDFNFPFSNSRNQGVHTLTLSGVVGNYQAGETITGPSGIRAVVVSGGTSPITIKSKSQEVFTIGEVLTGATSGATGTLATAKEDFNSGDKSILTIKDSINAIYTEIKRMKFGVGVTGKYWFEDAVSSLSDPRPELYIIDGGNIVWNGAQVSFNADFHIPVTGTAFVNTILQANSPIALNDGDVAYIDVNRGATVNITPVVVPLVNYVQAQNRFIIFYRHGTKLDMTDGQLI